jgi:hypothetical protein
MDEVLYAKDRMGRLPLSEVPHGKQTWYSSLSGIWQSVELESLPDSALEDVHVSSDLGSGEVQVSWTLRRALASSRLSLVVLGPQGQPVAAGDHELSAGEDHGSADLAVAAPEPWEPDRPALYTLVATVAPASGGSHERRLRFGFRTIEARAGQILINGRPQLLRGALDQDVYPEGLSLSGPRHPFYREQFRKAREMGLNLIRCHIKLPDPAYLDAADEAGILLWCELPNWTQFSSQAGLVGRATLKTMVETMGHHPSIVVWTIINEDWGTRLRDEARDRRWLLATYDWLKALDPSRLIVDNSACDSPSGKPNFHLVTDILDFHEYFSMPDKAVRWRNLVADFLNRPAWLWSPHGDARPRGDEPLVMSEFGNWGLPDVAKFKSADGEDPWWFATGRQLYQPGGAVERFTHFGLSRIWPTWSAMAEATQSRQFEALQYQIGELRRHSAVGGYVITEFTDAYWEANGLLDIARDPKVFQARLPEINGPEILIANPERHDCWGGDRLTVDLTASAYNDGSAGPDRIEWELRANGSLATHGSRPIGRWPVNGAHGIGSLELALPRVDRTVAAVLEIRAVETSGRVRALASWSLSILPEARRRTASPKRIAVDDPLGIWGLEERVRALGHEPVPLEEAELLITTELNMAGRRHAELGGRVLVLVRSRTALPPEVELEREIMIHPRWLADGDSATDPRNPWRGDWISAFSWIEPGRYPDLPAVNPLDFSYREVIPDHVLRGYHPQRHTDEVTAGMFVGWVHAPAAVLWRFRQGRGVVTATTFKLAPEDGPVATVLLEDLVQAGGGEQLRPQREELSRVPVRPR